jgi:hypothetical protein
MQLRSFHKCEKNSSFYKSLFLKPVFRISIWCPDQDPVFFTSRRILIRGAKPMWIHADPDPDPGQTLLSQKVASSHEKYTFCRYYVIIKHAYVGLKTNLKGSGFRRAKSMRIHADPDPKHCLKLWDICRTSEYVFMLILSMRQDP